MEFEYEMIDAKDVVSPRLTIPDNMEYEFIDEELVEITRREKQEKIEAFFPYGSYSAERTYRDYWTETDHDLLSSLVSIKVMRMNRRGKVAILDDIVEFRRLPRQKAMELIEHLFNHEMKFSVYHD